MIVEPIFIPRILLCGDATEFFERVDNRPFELVGQIHFSGEINGQEFNFLRDGKFLLGDNLFEGTEIPKMLRSDIDFLVFCKFSMIEFASGMLYQLGCIRSQMITLREFNNLPLDGFYDLHLDNQLISALKNYSIKTLLDVDAHFIKSYLMTKKVNDSLEIDCICREKIFPAKENIFCHVYKNFSDCALRHYDAALINERTPSEFDNIFSRLKNTVDLVITFVRTDSALEKHIRSTLDRYERVEAISYPAGSYFFCHVKKPSENFAMYVVTHKKLPTEYVQNFPAGYKVIHAGRILGNDLGYLGDDTGDNISDLNLYINEMTALYWIWKNTSQEIVGLSHYRRFFTTNNKNFLSKEEATDILKSYDIITDTLSIHFATTREVLRTICRDEITVSFVETVVRKNLMLTHPDYLDAFDYKMNSPTCYYKNMFVTRRPILEAYCQWLFSFFIDSTREVLTQTSLSNMESDARRLMGHFAERMLTVWLLKNRLRIKELTIFQVSGV